MLFSSDKDGDSYSNFHYYYDGIFPTLIVILDTQERRFGGYSTHNWAYSPIGCSYTRAPGSFIFNLTNKEKYDLNYPFYNSAIYRYSSYGPTFGNGHDIYLADGCKSNSNSYCTKSAYNTGNTNNFRRKWTN